MPDPTYDRIGDHTEVVEIVFDPAKISYERLLEVFWSAHAPERRIWSRQYRNAVFYIGEDQREIASLSREKIKEKIAVPVKSDIEPLDTFYPAEGYHQKYMLRRYKSLFAELSRQFGSEKAALDSTLAARINGYLGGYGNRAGIEEYVGRSDLSGKSRKRILEALEGRSR